VCHPHHVAVLHDQEICAHCGTLLSDATAVAMRALYGDKPQTFDTRAVGGQLRSIIRANPYWPPMDHVSTALEALIGAPLVGLVRAAKHTIWCDEHRHTDNLCPDDCR